MSRGVFLSLAVFAAALSSAYYFYASDRLHAEQLRQDNLPVCENPNGRFAIFYKPERLVIDASIGVEDEAAADYPAFLKYDALAERILNTAKYNFARCLQRGPAGVVLHDGRNNKRPGAELSKDENLILRLYVQYKHHKEDSIKGLVSCQFFRSGLPAEETYLSTVLGRTSIELNEGDRADAIQLLEGQVTSAFDACLSPAGTWQIPATLRGSIP